MHEVLEQIGEEGMRRLVAAFYRRVRSDAKIGPLYPEADWEGAEGRLADFMVYRCGGSTKYVDERGHPRLRMRHAHFAIGDAERDRWLQLMREAMVETEVPQPAADRLDAFFALTADFMRNREG